MALSQPHAARATLGLGCTIATLPGKAAPRAADHTLAARHHSRIRHLRAVLRHAVSRTVAFGLSRGCGAPAVFTSEAGAVGGAAGQSVWLAASCQRHRDDDLAAVLKARLTRWWDAKKPYGSGDLPLRSRTVLTRWML